LNLANPTNYALGMSIERWRVGIVLLLFFFLLFFFFEVLFFMFCFFSFSVFLFFLLFLSFLCLCVQSQLLEIFQNCKISIQSFSNSNNVWSTKNQNRTHKRRQIPNRSRRTVWVVILACVARIHSHSQGNSR
jgi:hypothetical protein